MNEIVDYIVVGGGIIGMTTARELAIRGQKVAIFDKGKLGMESSWAAGGILSPMRPWTEKPEAFELSEQGKKIYPDYVASLKEETGIDAELEQSGLVIIQNKHIESTKKWAASKCINLVEGPLDITAEINIPEHSILLPDIYQIRPSRLIKALRKSLEQLSVSIFEGTEVKNIVTDNHQFDHFEYDRGKIHAGAVIVTAGAWSSQLLARFNEHINIKPVRGQMLCLKLETQMMKPMILDGGHYLIPRLDGHMLIGSTMEETGFENKTTESAKNELLNWAGKISSSLDASKIVKHWSGLRPSIDRGAPVIGQIPGYKNVFVNSGHFRKGILQAPSSAKLLVDYLSGGSSFMDIQQFSPSNKTDSVENTI